MGSDKRHDNQAYGSELPQHQVSLSAYQIARFPVTVAEYACAVRAKAVREPPKGYLGTDWQTQLQRLDHPVVCISWQDALVYTRWLAKMTGQPWRLPTEAEWEKAARWDAERQISRVYPWGDAFDKARCNTSESGIKTTTSVGSYPGGDSPSGALDMAGNVWEWTSTLFAPYPYTASDSREVEDSTRHRVLRGGSWDNGAKDARAACRSATRPDYFSDGGFGFRLALTPAGS